MESMCHGAEFCNPSQTVSHQHTGDDVGDVAAWKLCFLTTYLRQPLHPACNERPKYGNASFGRREGPSSYPSVSFYILYYNFHKNGNPYMLSPGQMPSTDITITSGDDLTPPPIAQKACHEAHCTLGVWLTPSRCSEKQGLVCEARSNHIAEGMRLSHMARNEALMGYRHIWLPSVGYALACWPVGTLQLCHIEKQAVNAFLPKMGFSSTSCHAVIFGSRAYRGYGLTCLCNYQGVNQASMLLQHIRLNNSIGKMLLIA
jgi:hypothetical protein